MREKDTKNNTRQDLVYVFVHLYKHTAKDGLSKEATGDSWQGRSSRQSKSMSQDASSTWAGNDQWMCGCLTRCL